MIYAVFGLVALVIVVRSSDVVGVSCFFFQAEDGIRDLVRSRGLGDVYKRQVVDHGRDAVVQRDLEEIRRELFALANVDRHDAIAVSYTHLTLPTSDLV